VLPGSLLLEGVHGRSPSSGPRPKAVDRLGRGKRRVKGLVPAASHGCRIVDPVRGSEPVPAEHGGLAIAVVTPSLEGGSGGHFVGGASHDVVLTTPVHFPVQALELARELAGHTSWPPHAVALHLEYDLHVVRLAPASDLSADVVWSGSGDEVVVLAGLELQASG